MRRMGDDAIRRVGDGETERLRDGEAERQGDGEMGRLGEWGMFMFCVRCLEVGGLDCQIYLTEDGAFFDVGIAFAD